jgi:uncharacterized SAM-binding protein YcdF (DUF218 family)
MSSRAAHRLALFRDPDVWHAMTVSAAACAFSAGLVYVAYFVHVLRVARAASCVPQHGECVLVFGKHSPRGEIDRDFAARVERAALLWRERPPRTLVLLGGGPPGVASEAEVARAALWARGVATDAPLRLENGSRDTLQNLRNARQLLSPPRRTEPPSPAAPTRVTLLSSRYHLARCALFARQLGFDWELCAAESRLRWSPGMLWRIAGEAAYVCCADLGTRWARLIGSRRMLARVT